MPETTTPAEAGARAAELRDTLRHLESNIAALRGVSVHLEEGGLEGLLGALTDGMDVEELERHQLRYGCGRGRDSLLAKLVTLSPEDVDSIVDENGRFAADCAFCGRRYEFSRDEIDPSAIN